MKRTVIALILAGAVCSQAHAGDATSTALSAMFDDQTKVTGECLWNRLEIDHERWPNLTSGELAGIAFEGCDRELHQLALYRVLQIMRNTYGSDPIAAMNAPGSGERIGNAVAVLKTSIKADLMPKLINWAQAIRAGKKK
jgi:hypothetical protein